jgi:hypothetical protein
VPLPPAATVRVDGVKVYSALVPAARAIELTVRLAVPVFWIATVRVEGLLTVTFPNARDDGLRLIAGAAAAATVTEREAARTAAWLAVVWLLES